MNLQEKKTPNLLTEDWGFTLIEVLVTVAVVGIMMTLATAIFINTIRNSKKSEITAEARENAALVIDRIQRDGRDATSLSGASAPGATTLNINKSDGSSITWMCRPSGVATNGWISRNGITVTNKDPVEGVDIQNCLFLNINTSPPTMRFSFTVHEGKSVQSGSQEYGVNLSFQTSFSPR